MEVTRGPAGPRSHSRLCGADGSEARPARRPDPRLDFRSRLLNRPELGHGFRVGLRFLTCWAETIGSVLSVSVEHSRSQKGTQAAALTASCPGHLNTLPLLNRKPVQASYHHHTPENQTEAHPARGPGVESSEPGNWVAASPLMSPRPQRPLGPSSPAPLGPVATQWP